jgi:hypothetical protein
MNNVDSILDYLPPVRGVFPFELLDSIRQPLAPKSEEIKLPAGCTLPEDPVAKQIVLLGLRRRGLIH